MILIGNAKNKNIIIILFSIIVCGIIFVFSYIFVPHDSIQNIRVESNIGRIDCWWEDSNFISSAKLIISVADVNGNTVMSEECPVRKKHYSFEDGVGGERYTVTISDSRNGEQTYSVERLFFTEDTVPHIPLLVINTISGNEPTHDIIEADDGNWGRSIINNDYEECISQYYIGGVEIEAVGKVKVRGNTSSADSEKKSYKIKYDKNIDMLGLGKEFASDEWVLLNRGWNLRYYLGEFVGESCGVALNNKMLFVNVMLNGDWKGIYVLIQPVDRKTYSSEISKNGYLFECDAYYWKPGEMFFKTEHQIEQLGYTLKYPKMDNNNDTHFLWLSEYMQEIENAIYVNDTEYLSNNLDFNSFSACILARDIMGQMDAAGSNTYYYLSDTNNNTIIHMGPLWDFDSAGAVSDSWSRMHRWESNYAKLLWNNEEFRMSYNDCWINAREQLSDIERFLSCLNVEELDKSRILDAHRWGNEILTLEEYREIEKRLIPEIDDNDIPIWKQLSIIPMYTRDEINFWVEYFDGRIKWIDENIQDDCFPKDQ